MTILVIDDSPEVISTLVGLLEDSYTLKAATDGKKALEYLHSDAKNIDLILLDILMPGVDGYEVCRRIKKEPATAHIPVIFLTALEKIEDILLGFEMGAVDYVTKPFEPVVLKARINTHIELKKAQDTLREELAVKEELLLIQSRMALLGRMFEDVAHQWKQPLSIISFTSSNLRMDWDMGHCDFDKAKAALESIDAAVGYLSQTLTDFRELLYDSAQKEHFGIVAQTSKALKLLSSKLRNRNITVTLPQNEANLLGFKNAFLQLITNIFTNAIEALERIETPRTIDITLEASPDVIDLRICDDAHGIPAQHLERIFEKHFTTKSFQEGSGLGLYLCRQIMEKQFNGTIEAHNNGTQGACFHMRFIRPIEE
ncbi:MAG: hypothetical protein KU37_02530 [Sulfuricurvum sp. PC08-66]|nr:MAG: hypothetical protein KU37_02530 [Sulfuricurvum sp. PC08-66]